MMEFARRENGDKCRLVGQGGRGPFVPAGLLGPQHPAAELVRSFKAFGAGQAGSGTPTRFHQRQTRLPLGKEAPKLRPTQPALLSDLSGVASNRDLKDVFCKIDRDGCRVYHRTPLFGLRTATLAHRCRSSRRRSPSNRGKPR